MNTCVHSTMTFKLGFVSHNVAHHHAIPDHLHFYFDLHSSKFEKQNESISSMTTIATDELETKNHRESTHF